MATQDLTKGSAGVPCSGLNKVYVISNTIDFNDYTLTTGDVLQLLKVPAGTLVQTVIVEIDTQSAATALTGTVGDGDNADGWDTAVDFEAAAGTTTYTGLALTEGTPNTLTDGYAGGKVYTAADTIDIVLTINTVTTYGGFTIKALCVEL